MGEGWAINVRKGPAMRQGTRCCRSEILHQKEGIRSFEVLAISSVYHHNSMHEMNECVKLRIVYFYAKRRNRCGLSRSEQKNHPIS